MKKCLRFVMIFLTCFCFSGCKETPKSVEVNGVIVATEEYAKLADEQNAESLEDESITTEEMNQKTILESADCRIEKKVQNTTGNQLVIEAAVDIGEVKCMSRYEYVLGQPTEQLRKEIFHTYFGDNDIEAQCTNNGTWEYIKSSAGGDYYLYSTKCVHAGPTVPGEIAFLLEYRYPNLYPFKDNLLKDINLSKSDITWEKAIGLCDDFVCSISDLKDRVAENVFAYGTQGRTPYYRIVYKKYLDNMPITGFNDLCFLVDDNGIEYIYGSIYDVRKTEKVERILSAEEAANKLISNIDLIRFEGEENISIVRVAPEYLVVTSAQGDFVEPIWRFYLGETVSEIEYFKEEILAVNAITGELIQEERGRYF